ncbi:metal tolerance protein C2 [Morus notabilis]|uniref:metal tolerance protein C2 n=1 Tax=Morus notabilis TaxID=981085 RepID=UPI000CECF32A|nr:metal tolerance protein C2 [Morus notabilis]
MEKKDSFNYRARPETERQSSFNGDFGLGVSDRRFAFSRQASFQQHHHEPRTPISNSLNDGCARSFLSRTVSSIDIPPQAYAEEENVKFFGEREVSGEKFSVLLLLASVFRTMRSGNRYMKRLFVLISLNVAYSTAELCIGLLTGRVGLVSDAFHLTFGCGLLTFSLFAMAASRGKPDGIYTYGYKRLEVLSAFTNALFLLFMAFSLAVEALHAFIEDESEHKHYLIVSAVTNLLVNLIGVWFFRHYARINLTYRKAEDMNYHSVCLHVLADSIRSAGLILASWLLSLGVQNAEVLCLGIVSVAVFMLVMPLFRATGGILLQMAPPSIPPSALTKCWRQITSHEEVSEVSQARFWELVPGHVVGSLSIQAKKGMDERPILQYVHGLYHELGIHDLTLQVDV